MYSDVMEKIGKRLKEIREKKGFPQKVVASHLGLHRSNYSKVENDLQKLTSEQVALFCEFCDVSADYVLGIKPNDKVTVDGATMRHIIDTLNEVLDLIK